MTWLSHHEISEKLASEASDAVKQGQIDSAVLLYYKAAEFEEFGLEELDKNKIRTLGICVVSTASLFFKARAYERAEQTIYKWMNFVNLPDFAKKQLKDILSRVWIEMEKCKAGISFSSEQVVVSVKGGKIVHGGAPLDLIVEKVQIIQSLLYRTAEFLSGIPHRFRGGPSQEIKDMYQPWLFQMPPGSYQFAITIEEPRQKDFFSSDKPKVKDISKYFLDTIRATISDQEDELFDMIPNDDYRNTILKLTRNLAPTGKTFNQLEIGSNEEKKILISTESRKMITKCINDNMNKNNTYSDEKILSLSGILRAVHLDEDWIDLTVNGRQVRVNKLNDTVDDIIGPMVNHSVRVKVGENRQGKYFFRDIESDD